MCSRAKLEKGRSGALKADNYTCLWQATKSLMTLCFCCRIRRSFFLRQGIWARRTRCPSLPTPALRGSIFRCAVTNRKRRRRRRRKKMKGGDERRREPIKAEIRRTIGAIKWRLLLEIFSACYYFHIFHSLYPPPLPFILTWFLLPWNTPFSPREKRDSSWKPGSGPKAAEVTIRDRACSITDNQWSQERALNPLTPAQPDFL